MLCQPGGAQGSDEDGAWHARHRPRQLPVGGHSARGSAATHQSAQTGQGHGVRHLQRGRAHLRPRCECSADPTLVTSGSYTTFRHI